MSTEPSPRALAAQGATIVASILLALVLGAAWEYGADRVEESEILEGLAAEFEAGHRELESDQEARAWIMETTERLLEQARTSGVVSDDSVSIYLAALVNYRYYTPSHPVLDDLIGSGRLELVRSDELRRALLGYIRERDRLAVVEERERDFVADRLEPWVADAFVVDLPEVWLEGEGRPFPTVRGADAGVALGTDLARTLAYQRWKRAETSSRFGEGLEAHIERVLELLGP